MSDRVTVKASLTVQPAACCLYSTTRAKTQFYPNCFLTPSNLDLGFCGCTTEAVKKEPPRESGMGVSITLRCSNSSIVSKTKGNKMKKFADSVKKFLVSEDGPTAVEYAVMLALIIVVCLAAVSAVGTKANAKFNAVSGYLN